MAGARQADKPAESPVIYSVYPPTSLAYCTYYGIYGIQSRHICKYIQSWECVQENLGSIELSRIASQLLFEPSPAEL